MGESDCTWNNMCLYGTFYGISFSVCTLPLCIVYCITVDEFLLICLVSNLFLGMLSAVEGILFVMCLPA